MTKTATKVQSLSKNENKAKMLECVSRPLKGFTPSQLLLLRLTSPSQLDKVEVEKELKSRSFGR